MNQKIKSILKRKIWGYNGMYEITFINDDKIRIQVRGNKMSVRCGFNNQPLKETYNWYVKNKDEILRRIKNSEFVKEEEKSNV